MKWSPFPFDDETDMFDAPYEAFEDKIESKGIKQAGAEQCQAQQSLSQQPLAPSQVPTSWELVTQQLPTSWELTEALQDLKTTILGVGCMVRGV